MKKKDSLTRRGLLLAGAGSAVTFSTALAQKDQELDPKNVRITDLCDYNTLRSGPNMPHGDLCRVKGKVSASLGNDVLVGLWVMASRDSSEEHDDIKSGGSMVTDIAGQNWTFENLSDVEFSTVNYVHAVSEYSTPMGTYYHYADRSAGFTPVRVTTCTCTTAAKQSSPSRKRGRQDWVAVIPKTSSGGRHEYDDLSVAQPGHGNLLAIVQGNKVRPLTANRIRVRATRVSWRNRNSATQFITSPKGNNTPARSPSCQQPTQYRVKCACKHQRGEFAHYRFMHGNKKFPQLGIFVHQTGNRVHPVAKNVGEWTDWISLAPSKPIFVQVNDLVYHYRGNSGGFDLEVQVG